MIRSGLSFETENDKHRIKVELRDILSEIENKIVVLLIEINNAVENADTKTKGIIEGIVRIENGIIKIGDKIFSPDTRVLGVQYIFQ